MAWRLALSVSPDFTAEAVARRIVYAAAKAQGASEDEARAIEAVADNALRTAHVPEGPPAAGTEDEAGSLWIELGFDGRGFLLRVYEPAGTAPLSAPRRREPVH